MTNAVILSPCYPDPDQHGLLLPDPSGKDHPEDCLWGTEDFRATGELLVVFSFISWNVFNVVSLLLLHST